MNDHPQTDYIFADWVFPVSRPPIPKGFVAVQQGRITAVGPTDALSADIQKRQPPPGQSPRLLTPGLINTHAHLELSFDAMIPLASGEDMTDWLFRVFESKRDADGPAHRLQRCESGALEMLRAGTTCINDISTDGASLSVMDEAGLRGVVSMEFFHPDWEHLDVASAIECYQANFSAYEQHSRLRPGLSPHSLYNVSPKAWKAVVQACRPWLVHSHLAESKAEKAWLGQQESTFNRLHERILGRRFLPENRVKTSAGAYLAEHDLWSQRLVVAHGVYLTAEERKALAAHQVGIAHCPRSNLHLQGETLDWRGWYDVDAKLALGTDSRLSASTLDLRDEARVAVGHHGWSAGKVLDAVTMDAAEVMHMADTIGSLDVGKRADLVLWEAHKGPEATLAEPEGLWLAPETRATQVWVEGQSVLA